MSAKQIGQAGRNARLFCGALALLGASFLAACAGAGAREGSGEPRFGDYPAEPFAGTPAPVDLDSNPGARHFRTALRTGAAAGPNFAGDLTIVTWGCGTQCMGYAIVGARNGRVYADTTLDFSCHAVEYRADSRLVVQRPDSSTYGPCSSEPARFFQWQDERLIEITADEPRG